eukprot:c17325_g1_i2.p1 GENE.c17325_g1_i2~~c17325_g1_i2.p1  ORF type:complete len:534 (-),score=101.81 c17325_g1_i2:1106-2494(-)
MTGTFEQFQKLMDILQCITSAVSFTSLVVDEQALATLLGVFSQNEAMARHCLNISTWVQNVQELCDQLAETQIELDSPSSDRKTLGSADNQSPALFHAQTMQDFEKVRFISQGGFGKVFLCRKKTTGDMFAIKVISKRQLKTRQYLERIRTERDILLRMDNPWIVRLFSCFESHRHIHLVMEFVSGGDCLAILHEIGMFTEETAKFYLAETVLAIKSLHSAKIVHGDIKPDNLLIGSDGHIKLTDFGLSHPTDKDTNKLLPMEAGRVAGTPDYLAPEILLNIGNDEATDWWALGVVMFEFMTGITPFNAPTPEAIFDNILHRRIVWPSVPDELTYEAQDLIAQLLTPNPAERISADGIMQHPFFLGIDWASLRNSEPPFVPDPNMWYFDAGRAKERSDSSTPAKDHTSTSEDGEANMESFDLLNLKSLHNINRTVSTRHSTASYSPDTRTSGTDPLPSRFAD